MKIDRAESIRVTEEAIERVDRAALEDWKSEAFSLVFEVARGKEFLTSQDIWAAGLRSTRNTSALGPVMREAAKQGWIELVQGSVMSDIPEQHRRPMRVWRSLIHG